MGLFGGTFPNMGGSSKSPNLQLCLAAPLVYFKFIVASEYYKNDSLQYCNIQIQRQEVTSKYAQLSPSSLV